MTLLSRSSASVWLALFVVALSGCDLIRDYQRRTLFPHERVSAPEEPPQIEGLERMWIEADGSRVEAWYLPPLAPSERRAPAVIFAHGNGELIDHWAERLEPYRRMGFAVLLPEYRGYGRSSGTPSEAAIVADYERFYDLLVERDDIDGARVLLHGRSLGGGVVGALSARRRAAALILESTFTNVPDVASRWFAPSGFIHDRFDTRAVLATSSLPVLILHGLEDDVIPFKHARELHRVAWDSRLVAYEAGHSLPRTDDDYWSPIRAFVERAGLLSP